MGKKRERITQRFTRADAKRELLKRDMRERRALMNTLAINKREARELQEWLKSQPMDEDLSRNEAASLELIGKELFQNIATKAAKKIKANRKRWKARPRAAAGCHYSELAVMLYDLSDQEVSRLRRSLEKLMSEYILAVLDSDHDRFKLPAEATVYACQRMDKGPHNVVWFLGAVAKRRRENNHPQSLLRVRQLLSSLSDWYGHNRHLIADHLEKIGAAKHTPSLRKSIGQYLSRDQTKAHKKWRKRIGGN